ncbi:MAG: hypothetical protein U1A07_13485, partial [Phenylobacterium sp.]|nr:hypothetical protein [Phenylobacterium sp.]
VSEADIIWPAPLNGAARRLTLQWFLSRVWRAIFDGYQLKAWRSWFKSASIQEVVSKLMLGALMIVANTVGD